MHGFQWYFVAVNGPVMVGLEKYCFLWFCGVAMAAGLGKACFQWFVAYGPEKAYYLWLILVVFWMTSL